jgi:hypothetical protein
MGLKLHHLDAEGARGELDGQPFALQAHDSGWKAVIGDKEQSWNGEHSLWSKGRRAISEIRNMTYHAIAVYRQSQRLGA